MSARGRFITLEGGEGSGKSTQLARLEKRLKERGIPVVATREPGGSPGAEEIRKLLLGGAGDRWHPLAELYLFLGARADHVQKLIVPALERGIWVLCDRFHDSTRIYQGYAGGIGLSLVDRLQEPLLALASPDLTLLLDLPPSLGLARSRMKGRETRFERRDLAFHERVREGFLGLAEREPERFLVVDARGSPEDVEMRIWNGLCRRLGMDP